MLKLFKEGEEQKYCTEKIMEKLEAKIEDALTYRI